MKKIIELLTFGTLMLGISGNAYIKNYGEGPYTEEQEAEFQRDMQKQSNSKASLFGIELNSDFTYSCYAFQKALIDIGEDENFKFGDKKCGNYYNYLESRDGKTVTGILVNYETLGIPLMTSVVDVANMYINSENAIVRELTLQSKREKNAGRITTLYWADGINKQNQKITIYGMGIYLEQLPKGKF